MVVTCGRNAQGRACCMRLHCTEDKLSKTGSGRDQKGQVRGGLPLNRALNFSESLLERKVDGEIVFMRKKDSFCRL